MAEGTARSVRIERTAAGRYVAHNSRGGKITVSSASGPDFTPVELLLAAIGGCTSADVDTATSRHGEPTAFSVTVSGDKIRDEDGNRMTNLSVTFEVAFPDGTEGDAARTILPRAVRLSHDRLCTVSRTVELGTPIDARISRG
jgi:putative redox protein